MQMTGCSRDAWHHAAECHQAPLQGAQVNRSAALKGRLAHAACCIGATTAPPRPRSLPPRPPAAAACQVKRCSDEEAPHTCMLSCPWCTHCTWCPRDWCCDTQAAAPCLWATCSKCGYGTCMALSAALWNDVPECQCLLLRRCCWQGQGGQQSPRQPQSVQLVHWS
jgi:hypothetical protein